MDIADGALDKMFEIYKEILPTLGGYITEVSTNLIYLKLFTSIHCAPLAERRN